ncbi:MAG TPA: hypothetical protein VHS52_10815 [Acidimicrobiales bacterium]|jgi:hypothetical protein|nr:hypothetical protein [Acidimicrobiales bacterium]
MGATLSTSERQILEAVDDAEAGEVADSAGQLTDVVRRALGQLPGDEFRRGVAALSGRRLLQAHVAMKAGGEVGRVVIERVTFLGRRAIGR